MFGKSVIKIQGEATFDNGFAPKSKPTLKFNGNFEKGSVRIRNMDFQLVPLNESAERFINSGLEAALIKMGKANGATKFVDHSRPFEIKVVF